MSKFVGLDVSQKETEICVVDADGRRIWRGKCRTEPKSILVALREHADGAVRIGMETGPLSIWLWHELREAGIDVDCTALTFSRIRSGSVDPAMSGPIWA